MIEAGRVFAVLEERVRIKKLISLVPDTLLNRKGNNVVPPSHGQHDDQIYARDHSLDKEGWKSFCLGSLILLAALGYFEFTTLCIK